MNSPALRALVASSILTCLVPDLCAQDAAARHAAATNQLQRLAAEQTSRCLADIRTAADWQQQRPRLLTELRYVLGLEPMPARTPLRARITGTLDRPQFRIEKVVFESSPGLYVTGNFYVPKDTATPAPTILYLCGHSPHPAGAKTQFQDRTLWFASHGWCVLAIDTLEFAEVPGIHHGTHDLGMWHWLSLGYTPAGVETWNAIRALDWLETRPEVDAKRIGVTGISGGGAMTWYLAAVDERVAVAAPSCSTFTYGSQAQHWLASGQCDCIYYHNTFGWDFPVVAALIAPRPLLITSGQRDTIFPPDGYHDVYQRAKRIYELVPGGSGDRIREVDADAPHSDPPAFLKASREWMNGWIRHDPTPVPEDAPLPPKDEPAVLACLTDIPADATNFSIQNTFTSPVTLTAPRSAAAWRQRRADVLAQLRDKVFRWLPTAPTPFNTEVARGSAGWAGRWAEYKEITFESEPGVRIRGRLYTVRTNATSAPLVIQVKGFGENFWGSDVDELLPLFGRVNVLTLSPRFTERDVPAREYTDIERTAAWIGRTISAMHVWDVMRAVEWALTDERLAPSRVAIYGRGDMAIVGLYAGLFDQRIGQVIVADPPGSHWQRPALLNVLRVTDIPEVAGMLAPRELVFLREIPEPFALTKTAYRLAKARGQVRVASDLPAAVGLTAQTTRR